MLDDTTRGAAPRRSLRFAQVFLAYAALCFITAIILNWGTQSLSETLPAEGGTVGPLEVPKDNTVYLVEVRSDVDQNSWTYVGGSVLDSNQQYLFGFGDEFWHESGRDSEGYWSESKTEYDLKLTMPTQGTYFLKFDTDAKSVVESPISVKVTKKVGSYIAHMWLGVCAMIVAVFFWLKGANVDGSSLIEDD